MGSVNGHPQPDDEKRHVEALQKEIRHLFGQLEEAKHSVAQLKDRLRKQTGQLGKDSQAQQEIRNLSRQIERQALILERDNTVARKLQDGLRPLLPEPFEGIQFAVASVPGTRVGGDFYDVIRISDSSIGLLIADVSGYGLTAAVIMATARLAFRTFATMESSPLAIMTRVNESLLETTLAGHHLTAFMGLLDSDMLTLQYVNASHPSPCLIRDKDVTLLDTEGLFVGMFEDPQYEQKSIQLENKDKLFLFTDGLIRLFDGEATGEAVAALQDFLRRHSQLSVEELTSLLCKEVIRDPVHDVAILAAELLRSKASHKTVTIYSIPTEVRRAEDTILPVLSAKGYSERALFAVRLALEEATVNAIQHGNKLDNTKKVTIDFTIEDDKVVMSVTDEGEGFDPQTVPDPTLDENLEAVSGRGIALMRAYMDSVEFDKKGNKVTLTKFAPWHTKKP